MSKKVLIGIISILFTLVSPTFAFATALVSTSPPAGASLTITPSALSIETDTPLLDQGNQIEVIDPSGVRVDDGALAVQDMSISVGLRPFSNSGLYTVKYLLLGTDNSPLSGDFSFTYTAPSVVNSASPTAPTDIGTASSSATPTTVNKATDYIIIGMLIASGLVFILMVMYAIRIFNEWRARRR